jgi:hypothetical protein
VCPTRDSPLAAVGGIKVIMARQAGP